MLNHIWAFLIAVGILVGLYSAINKVSTGEQVVSTRPDGTTVTETRRYRTAAEKVQAFASVGNKITADAVNAVSFRYTDPVTKAEKSGAVGIAVDYIGIMALWLGFMKIAEASGLIQLLARCIAPIFRFLFPRVPVNHPAAGAVLMNVAANMLGLDNAATPLGIKAMKELQELNGQKDTASNAMCMFLALNTSSLTLLPASILAYRIAMKSVNPAVIIFPILIATGCGKIVAIISCKIFERFSPDTPPADDIVATAPADEASER